MRRNRGWTAKWSWFLVLFLVFTVIGQVYSSKRFTLDQDILQKVEQKYGRGAVRRLHNWEQLIAGDSSGGDMEKLKKVNDFFNKNQFVRDSLLWKQEDYWATPIEFLAIDAGDCEDFSIAKYFTLRAIGVAEKKLFLTYVKALELNEAHMVLAYYEQPNSVPLILDNINPVIKPATKRKDLLPVYRFNGSSLWLAKQRGGGKYVGDSQSRLKRWRNVLSRMPDSLK
ncbi:MAG: transglutaminase-like cysteine peptidase [Thermodesulfobacteriota bacterium]